jgi:Fic family protein
LIHYQFETIHIFLDRNETINDLFITLYLIAKDLLKQSKLFLSDFFEKNRRDYYDSLMFMSTKDDLINELSFFLNGFAISTCLMFYNYNFNRRMFLG